MVAPWQPQQTRHRHRQSSTQRGGSSSRPRSGRALGFRPRQEVVLTLDGSSIRITTAEVALEAAVARVQSLARKYGGGGGGEVDAFIAERRAEAGKDIVRSLA